MTEIEKTKAEIEVLQKKLELLKEIETHKSQPRMEHQESGTVDKVEYNGHTYLRIMYNDSTSFGGVWWKQIERHKSPMNIVTDDITRNVLEGLWYGQVKKDESTKPMDEVVDREENPPSFLRFELDKTLEDLITRWWCDVFTTHDDWDMETAIDDLVEQIQLWLPKEQSHEETQSTSVIDLVDGYNDALRKIKSKLRNKK